MTTTYHDPIASLAMADAATFNAPLGQLDAAMNTLAINFAVTGSTTATLTSGVSSAGQKVIDVDSTTGFLAGAPVAYTLVGGVIETNYVGTVNSLTRLTMTSNIGTGGIADDTYLTVLNLGSISSSGVVPGALQQAQVFTEGLTLGGDLETPERITLLTTGALVEAPWVIDQYQVDPLKHDNVFAVNYNVKRLDDGSNQRVETGEHCILWNIESRFHPTDPGANRGQLEWYLRIDPALTGTPSFNLEPFSLVYNFDTEDTAVVFGDSDDAGNTFTFYGGAGGYMAVRAAPLYIRGTTSTDRLTLTMTSSGDSAQISSYDELAGVYLRLGVEAGGYILTNVSTTGGEAYHRWDVNNDRIAVINATGLGIFTTFPASRLDIDAGALTMKEMTAPGAPAANSVVIYAVDNGGKTELCARFPTGAVQQLAIEP